MSEPMEPDIKAASAATYAATASHFDAPALSFWGRFGGRTVARAGLRPGEQVLDACCGTGASALPAAHAVGPGGHVLGIDISEPALALARAKADSAGPSHVEFRAVDVERSGLPSASFDAVICVFGVLERGIARGEVRPDVRVDVARELGQSILWHRLLVTGDPITDELVMHIVDDVLIPYVSTGVQRRRAVRALKG